ncbi:MAG: hypothetical protein NC200_02495, partial [Candidatus Gastranaerophilales bacterium]|nr:hypothetical protein [Candidatus Gastranaerophilales bacterium]
NWSAHRTDQTPITKKDADTFINNVLNISNFPQKSFDNYAEKLKILDDKGLKADSFNPNNILVDYHNQELHIIDAYNYHVDAHLNTKYDLACLLVDYPNYGKYHEVMTDSQKKVFVDCTKTIFDKCEEASKRAGLNTSEDTFIEFISRIDGRENNGGMYRKSYDAMKDICKKS